MSDEVKRKDRMALWAPALLLILNAGWIGTAMGLDEHNTVRGRVWIGAVAGAFVVLFFARVGVVKKYYLQAAFGEKRKPVVLDRRFGIVVNRVDVWTGGA